MSRKGAYAGMLVTHYRDTYRPSQRDLWTLDLYARQAADFIDRKLADDALRQSEAQFQAMFGVSGVAAMRLDAETGHILVANETFARATGFSVSELAGLAIADLIQTGETCPDLSSLAAPGSQPGTSFQAECQFVRKDGSTYWGLLAGNAVPHSHPAQAVALILDVTSRREAELSLARENQHKDEFLAMLGHELRNPLAAIRSATSLLKEATVGPQDAHGIHGVLERQSIHMTRLIDGLLEISRVARGKLNVDLRTVDVGEVLGPVLEDRGQEIAKAGVELVSHLSQHVWVTGDPVRLAQVFDNLLGNAIKFTDQGGTITVTLEVHAEQAVVRVCDTGIGMRPEVLGRIFQPFQQEAQDAARSSGGLGLGLALAKALVELHSGTIEARSAGLGQGCQFEVRLPLVETPTDSQRSQRHNEVPATTILLVEDNADAAEMLAALLELRGHRVVRVEHGAAALEALAAEPFPVVLCDVGLPGMDGLEVARRIRQSDSLGNPILIALTGYGQPKDREQALGAGFDHHLIKPVDLDLLDACLFRPSAS